MKKESKYPIPIREWSEDDRPREKLLKYGEHIPCNVYPACPVGRNYRTGACPVAPADGTGVEFPDSSGTPLACPGATTQEHDPVLEKTIPSSAINPILVYQVWARGIQQGGPI